MLRTGRPKAFNHHPLSSAKGRKKKTQRDTPRSGRRARARYPCRVMWYRPFHSTQVTYSWFGRRKRLSAGVRGRRGVPERHRPGPSLPVPAGLRRTRRRPPGVLPRRSVRRGGVPARRRGGEEELEPVEVGESFLLELGERRRGVGGAGAGAAGGGQREVGIECGVELRWTCAFPGRAVRSFGRARQRRSMWTPASGGAYGAPNDELREGSTWSSARCCCCDGMGYVCAWCGCGWWNASPDEDDGGFELGLWWLWWWWGAWRLGRSLESGGLTDRQGEAMRERPRSLMGDSLSDQETAGRSVDRAIPRLPQFPPPGILTPGPSIEAVRNATPGQRRHH